MHGPRCTETMRTRFARHTCSGVERSFQRRLVRSRSSRRNASAAPLRRMSASPGDPTQATGARDGVCRLPLFPVWGWSSRGRRPLMSCGASVPCSSDRRRADGRISPELTNSIHHNKFASLGIFDQGHVDKGGEIAQFEVARRRRRSDPTPRGWPLVRRRRRGRRDR